MLIGALGIFVAMMKFANYASPEHKQLEEYNRELIKLDNDLYYQLNAIISSHNNAPSQKEF